MRQRLEEEQIAGVVIGADRLRVGVDHHRFDAQLPHRERRLHAAVVELDPLADAVRPAADDDDFGSVGEADFVFDVIRTSPFGAVDRERRLRRSSSNTAWRLRTRRRRCRRACRPARSSSARANCANRVGGDVPDVAQVERRCSPSCFGLADQHDVRSASQSPSSSSFRIALLVGRRSSSSSKSTNSFICAKNHGSIFVSS